MITAGEFLDKFDNWNAWMKLLDYECNIIAEDYIRNIMYKDGRSYVPIKDKQIMSFGFEPNYGAFEYILIIKLKGEYDNAEKRFV